MVAGIGEVVVPFKIINLGAMFAGNFNRAVGGAGVDNDDFDCDYWNEFLEPEVPLPSCAITAPTISAPHITIT